MRCCFPTKVACQDTPLQGSRLIVEDVPVLVFCPHCQEQRTLNSVQSFVQSAARRRGDVLRGKELEVFAL